MLLETRSLRQHLSDKIKAYSYLRAAKVQGRITENSATLTQAENLDNLAALIIRSLVPYQLPLRSRIAQNRIIFAAKGVFNDDIRYAFEHDNRFACFQYSRKVNKKLARCFIPEEFNHFTYKSNNADLQKAKVDARNFYRELFLKIKQKFPFDAYLCSNFGAFDEQELAVALEDLNISFMALHKECIMAPGMRQYLLDAFIQGRGPYNGSRVFVYNELARKQIEDSNLCDPSIIEVLGMPRLDALHHIRIKAANKGFHEKKNRIGCFFPSYHAQLPTLIDQTLDMKWQKLTVGTCRVLYNLAIERPETEIVVKAKLVDLESAHTTFANFGAIPKNILISTDILAYNLISASDVICSFNSTAILETIAAGVPCVIPQFGEAEEERFKPFLLDFSSSATVCKSEAELENAILSYAKEPIRAEKKLAPHSRDLLAYWTNNPDGKLGPIASGRIAEIIQARHKRHTTSKTNL